MTLTDMVFRWVPRIRKSSKIEDPRPNFDIPNLRNNLDFELREFSEDPTRDNRLIETYLNSLQAKGENKMYKEYLNKYERLRQRI